ncbi:MAG: hypothetical protein FJ295_02655 [Planctomycetes bacterium]|nr:hypothetical protein [Planctomycetota bacterium]
MENFQRPSKLNAALDPSIDAVLLRGLHADPHDRFPRIDQFGEQLQHALRRMVGRLRRRLGAASLAIAAIVVAGVAGQALVQGSYAPSNMERGHVS